MTLAHADRDERRSARDAAWRAGEDVLPHDSHCRCRECVREEVWASEAQGPK